MRQQAIGSQNVDDPPTPQTATGRAARAPRATLCRLALVGLTWVAGWGCSSLETGPFSKYYGRPLESLDAQARRDLLRLLGPDLPRRDRWLYEPRFLWWDRESRGLRLLLAADLVEIPGDSRLALCAVTGPRRVRVIQEFSAGWRRILRDVRMEADPEMGMLLHVITEPQVHARDIRTQVYGFIEGRMRLLGARALSGELTTTAYRYRHIGPPIAPRSREQWQANLASDNPVMVLEALASLATEFGTLAAKPLASDDPNERRRGQVAHSVGRALSDQGVQEQIASLCRSDNPRIRESACFLAKRLTSLPSTGSMP